MFGRENLGRYGDVGEFGFGDEGWMGCAEGVDEVMTCLVSFCYQRLNYDAIDAVFLSENDI